MVVARLAAAGGRSLAWSLVIDLALRAVAAAFLVATAVRLWATHRREPAGIPGALLCVGLIAYLAAPRVLAPDRATALSFLILLAAIANPGLIWLVARGLFRERAGVGPAQVLAVIAAVLLGLAFAYELPRRLFGPSGFTDFAGRVVPHGIALVFILLALIDAQRDVRNDLVEPRRRLRVVFVSAIAAYAALVAVVETALRGERPPASLELLHLAMIAGASVAAAVVVHRHGEELLGTRPAAVEPARVAAAAPIRTEPATPLEAPPVELRAERADPLRTELEAWLAGQGFLEPELTIAGLAKTLHTQEYKLRRLLNGELGFRNFNDFLHRQRIRVACERLTQPHAETSILELSLAVGYRSLATFNRAFKEVTGLNPTEYRARHGAPKYA